MKTFLAYRYLTGGDDAAFCHKVTHALGQGWNLRGETAFAFDAAAGEMRCGQAVTKEVAAPYAPDARLAEL
jgi:hypothetical protein